MYIESHSSVSVNFHLIFLFFLDYSMCEKLVMSKYRDQPFKVFGIIKSQPEEKQIIDAEVKNL